MRPNTSKGYDVEAGKLQGEPLGSVNGWLYQSDKGGPTAKSSSFLRIPETVRGSGGKAASKVHGRGLWVYEVQTGFSLSGTTGQSYQTRSFFPRNRVQQSITVLCQCPNQQNYADTVEWIRATQKSHSTSVKLAITTKVMPVKGQSLPLLVEGYIKSVPRSHRRFEYAPELRFDFLVERVDLPAAWADQLSAKELKGPRVLPTWKDVIEKQGKFRRDPDRIQDGADLPNPESFFHDSIACD